MQALKLLLLILGIQTGLAQTINTEKIYRFTKEFKIVEDSIAKKINLQNTIIYKTCEDSKVFYLIQENSHWTGYFIKSLLVGGVYLPPTLVTLPNGNIVDSESIKTELTLFDADNLVKELLKNRITKIKQLNESTIQAKLIKEKKNESISLPSSSHDCQETIIIYGKKNVAASYRGLLVDSEEMHTIPPLKIFYDTKQILINSTKSY